MKKRSFAKSQKMFSSVKERIPLAAQTFSKCYLQYVKGGSPLFVTHAKGSHVWDVDGNEYIDFINGLLPVILGHCYGPVDEAIKKQLKKGIAFPLPSPLEDELAKLLIKHIPCAEMVRYGKNGSDVTSGAIRVARAVTGREHVAACGYHGWHDWYIGSTTRKLGVPVSTQKLTHPFAYNDIASLKKLFKKYHGKIAAVIMEPMNYYEPDKDFLKQVKEIAHKNGALLVFDEVITGFRWGLGGAQKYFGITPDLATFGKSMANGMPISALVGKKIYMKRVADIFYSFTNGGEALSLAAAIATIKEMEKKNVIPTIWKKGTYLKEKVNALIKKNGLDSVIKIKGKPCWQVIFFTPSNGFSDLEIKSYVQQEILQEGILWYGQHNMSFSHSQKDLDTTIRAYAKVLPKLKQVLEKGTLKKELVGEPITNIFKVR
ncbi:MAG: aminotransferase class III-fold pyridoxal phosphate-dependent enzyme [Patescibacteria group bacterium]|jgi:glutamate-1-semialdehyde 2,1-aminomutase